MNAFCVSVFCMDESFESRSADFLRAAFACFPPCEYAVITLPHTTAEFSLVNSFVQVEPLPSSSFGHLLYVFHRDALGGPRALTVRPATVVDRKPLRPRRDARRRRGVGDVALAFEAATGPLADGAERTKAAYVAECVGQPIGLVVLDSECDVAALQAQYTLEDFVLFSEHPKDAHAMLDAFVINPIFTRSSRWIFKEIFRVHKKSCLYIKLNAGEAIPTVLSEFVQSKPRRQIQPSEALVSELDEQRAQLGLPARPSGGASGSLYFLTRKLLSEPKIINNARIVISGASDAAMSLLEALISVPYLHFAYIYLVAPQAGSRLNVPRGHVDGPGAPAPFFARSGGYTAAELAALGMGARVRLVDAAMVDIDRAAKAIILPDGSILPYDYLVIAPDFGDQSLVPLAERGAVPRGCFSLFDEESTGAALAIPRVDLRPAARQARRVRRVDRRVTRRCRRRSAAACARARSRTWCRRRPPMRPRPSPTRASRPRSRRRSRRWASRASEGMRLVGAEADDDGVVCNCMLEAASGQIVAQPCTLLLCAGAKEVQRTTFHAINGNSLVYDGRLVVDTNFCTNDKAIYAGGVITKLSRRYRSKLNMGTISGRECGARMAAALLPVLDPLSASTSGGALDEAVPTFEKPKMVGALLPGAAPLRVDRAAGARVRHLPEDQGALELRT